MNSKGLLAIALIWVAAGFGGSARAQTLLETMEASAISAEAAGVQGGGNPAAAVDDVAPEDQPVVEAGAENSPAGEAGAEDDSREINLLVSGEDEDGEVASIPQNVFTNPQVIQQWLGDNPRFVYYENNKPDPMLIPWLAADYEAGNLLKQAEAMWKGRGDNQQQAIQALRLMEKIMNEFPESDVAVKNAKIFNEWKEVYRKQFPNVGSQPVAAAPERMRFPPWIRQKFSSILFSNENLEQSRVLIDSVIYLKGEIVKGTEDVTGMPGPASVKILGIERLESDQRVGYVIFEFNGEKYYYGPKGVEVPGFENPKDKR